MYLENQNYNCVKVGANMRVVSTPPQSFDNGELIMTTRDDGCRCCYYKGETRALIFVEV